MFRNFFHLAVTFDNLSVLLNLIIKLTFCGPHSFGNEPKNLSEAEVSVYRLVKIRSKDKIPHGCDLSLHKITQRTHGVTQQIQQYLPN